MIREHVDTGIKVGVTRFEYDEMDAINNSILSIVHTRSPAHGKWAIENPPAPTPALIEGNAFHTMVLEPTLFEKRYAVWSGTDRRTKAGKAEWAEFQEISKDKVILTADQHSTLKAMQEAFVEQPCAKLFNGGDKEVALVWDDPVTGLRCKALLDVAHAELDVLVDLKTAMAGGRPAFAKEIYNRHYHQQAAFYSFGWETLTGKRPEFIFGAVEKDGEYIAYPYPLGPNTMRAGRNAYTSALKVWAECVANKVWPAYNEFNPQEPIEIPDWALRQEGVDPDGGDV